MVTQITIPRSQPATTLPQQVAVGQTSFVQRLLQIVVTLASVNPQNNQPNTFENGANQVTLPFLRASVRIENAGAPAGNTATIAVYGLTQSLMNQLSTLGQIFNSISQNSVTIFAGNPTDGFTQVFSGTAINAYGDYNRMPDVPFRFLCQTAAYNAVASATPASYTGPTDTSEIMSNFAGALGVGFENNGVSNQLSNPYFPGNLWSQVRRCAQHANINAEIVDGGTKLAIWPMGGSRTSLVSGIPLISPDTGMIGYPSFSPNGYLIVKMVFNPQVKFGGQIQVQSSLPQANKQWVVQKLDLALDSMVPKGHWMATAYCYPLGLTAPVPASH